MADFCPVCTGVPGMGSPPVAIFPGLGLLTRQSAGKIPHRVVNRCRKGCCKSIQSRDGKGNKPERGPNSGCLQEATKGPRRSRSCRTKARGTDPGGIGRPTALTAPGGLPRGPGTAPRPRPTGPGANEEGDVSSTCACTQLGGPGELAARQDRDTNLSSDVNRSAHSARSSFKPKLRNRPRSAARQAFGSLWLLRGASAW